MKKVKFIREYKYFPSPFIIGNTYQITREDDRMYWFELPKGDLFPASKVMFEKVDEVEKEESKIIKI